MYKGGEVGYGLIPPPLPLLRLPIHLIFASLSQKGKVWVFRFLPWISFSMKGGSTAANNPQALPTYPTHVYNEHSPSDPTFNTIQNNVLHSCNAQAQLSYTTWSHPKIKMRIQAPNIPDPEKISKEKTSSYLRDLDLPVLKSLSQTIARFLIILKKWVM